MPNAKDAEIKKAPRFLVLSRPGGGKTTQLLTLPGRKFVYCFDPGSLISLQGFDVDYEEFLPEGISMKATSLSKETQKKIPREQRPSKSAGANLYTKWEMDFESKIESGFFADYDIIAFDGITTLSDMVMDSILAINGRPGQWPNQDDYGPQMMAIASIVRNANGLGKTTYFTGHLDMVQDDLTKRVVNQPLMTGRLKTKLPILFSEILVLSADIDMKGNVTYTAQTKPDRYYETARCSLRGIPPKVDVTIDWKKDPVGQGLGGMYE